MMWLYDIMVLLYPICLEWQTFNSTVYVCVYFCTILSYDVGSLLNVQSVSENSWSNKRNAMASPSGVHENTSHLTSDYLGDSLLHVLPKKKNVWLCNLFTESTFPFAWRHKSTKHDITPMFHNPINFQWIKFNPILPLSP